MGILIILIPVSLVMGIAGLAAFLWSLRANQYEDLAGDAERILYAEDCPIAPRPSHSARQQKETAP